MARIYVYVVEYDLGFAPNPFHGTCTLACCKPLIRRKAEAGDWVVGMGGRALQATGRCIYAMQVTETMGLNDYWNARRFRSKRPQRNGSRIVMVGDNIYSRNANSEGWSQADSVHSGQGGEQDALNTAHDTQTDRMLISDDFVYFGSCAPFVPGAILSALPYRNGRGHRVYPKAQGEDLLQWIDAQGKRGVVRIHDDPFQLRLADRRYSIARKKLV